MIAGGGPGEILAIAEGNRVSISRQHPGGLADHHEVACLRCRVPWISQLAGRDNSRVVEDGPRPVDLLAILQVGHHDAVDDLPVVLSELWPDLIEVHQGQESQSRIDAFGPRLHLAQIVRREELTIGVEIVDHPCGQIRVLEGQPRDLFGPAVIVQAKWLGILIPILRRALRRRHQVHPDVDARLGGPGQKQLQVLPIGGSMPDEPVVRRDAQFLEPRDHRVNIHAPVRPAEFRIVVRQMLAEEPRLRHRWLPLSVLGNPRGRVGWIALRLGLRRRDQTRQQGHEEYHAPRPVPHSAHHGSFRCVPCSILIRTCSATGS